MLTRNRPMQWLLAALLACGFAPLVQAEAPQLPTENKSCPMKLLASLDVRGSERGQLLVPVSIAGHDVWMSLRLGEGILSLYSAAVADWHLKTIRMEIGGRRIEINGKPITDMVRENFSLGKQPFQNWPMILIPADAVPLIGSYEGKPIVGELATRFLMAVDAELNLAQNKINLFEHVKCGTDAVYWGGTITAVHLEFDQTGLLHFPMELEDQEIQTSFDTSQNSSRISTEVTKKFFGFDENSPGLQSEALPNGAQSHSYRAMSLTAKGVEIRNATIELWPTTSCYPDRSVSRLDGIGCTQVFGAMPFAIGTDLMRKLRIYIASKEGRIYFTRAEPPAP